jgi:hypothetical protein
MKRTNRLAAVALLGAVVACGAGIATSLLAATPTTQDVAHAKALVEKAKEQARNNKLAEAKASNDLALRLAPDLLDAKIMASLIESKMKAAGTGSAPAATGTAPVATTAAAGGLIVKLTPEQINRIKAFEITAADRSIAGTVDRKTLESFWKDVMLNDPRTRNATADDREIFYNSAFIDQVRKIRDSQRTEFIDKLKITGEPVAMQRFVEVNAWVVNNCAYQPGCHAMEDSKGKFLIYKRGGNLQANLYTNFYIMTQLKADGGMGLDREKPEESLILQYVLPADKAKYTHPGAKRVQQRFPDTKDANFQRFVNDIGMLNRFAPDYGIAQPVDTPATGPAATSTAPGK